MGSVVGLVSGFIGEGGLMQGALIGAMAGGLKSLELADTLARIWSLDDYCSTRSALLAAGGFRSGSVFRTIGSALDEQIDALAHFSRRDLFEPSSFPELVPRRAAMATTVTDEGQQTTCPICLDEFQAGEIVRGLPTCRHVFHLPCIDRWLLRNPECPMCRQIVY
uniref:Uncharacterized protein n=1 Tax=Avena sativa TaxID=4498 RepID=A0ACD5UVD8_AVESA